MASVEQREATHPAGLTSLELFDKFKVMEEEKDSDEESFHLPLLDSEEDVVVNNKDASNTPPQNGETEEDILNKFDCIVSTTEPVDPKVEDSILNEDLEDENKSSKIVPTKDEDKNEVVVQNGVKDDTEMAEVNSDIPNIDNKITVEDSEQPNENSQETEVNLPKETEEVEVKSDEVDTTQDTAMEVESEIVEKADYEDAPEAIIDNEEVDQIETKIDIGDVIMEVDNAIYQTVEIKKDPTETDESETDITTKVQEVTEKSTENDIVEEIIIKNEITEPNLNKKEDGTLSMELDENVENDEHSSENTKTNPEKNEDTDVPKNSEDSIVSSDNTDNAIEESCEIVNDVPKIPEDSIVIEEKSKLEETIVSAEKSLEVSTRNFDNKDEQNIEIIPEAKEQKLEETKMISMESDLSKSNGNKETESKETEQLDSKTNDESVSNIPNETEPKKVNDDVNESAKSESFDDLLDISVICDVDEDNAKADAENANDCQTSEKSDNDETEDKQDIEESENDQEETLCNSDKDDAMEFDDGASNSTLQFEENSSTNDTGALNNATIEKNINSESVDSTDSVSNKEDVEMMDVLPKVIAGLATVDSVSTPIEKIQTEEEKTESVVEREEPVEYLDLDQHMAEQKKALEATTSVKRSLPIEDVSQGVAAKKIRLSESPIKEAEAPKKPTDDGKTKTLTTFESYMRSKLFNKNLTKSDLEQFCMQKICEVIMHRSELGDLNQKVRKQEQVIETLRKDIQQLTKQSRDLEIVNKKLMNELKGQNGKPKPLVPLKITRSVGLQVKLTLGVEQARKRAPNTPIKPTITTGSNTTPVNNRQRTVTPNSNNVARQVAQPAPSPRKTQTGSGNTTPILSQALQTANNTNNNNNNRQSTTPSNTAKRTPIIRTKISESAKPSNPGVIDLTDEDDRASKPTGGTPIKILNKQMVTTPKLVPAKQPTGKSPANNQNKIISINQSKPGQVVTKGTPTRTVTTLPQGVRLTPTGTVKNGITLPASVVTSSTGGPQLMYVVQPSSSLVTTTAQGGQKTVLLNFQPGNGILTSALNGSSVSVIPTKSNVQVKTAPVSRKHPAPLPLPPPMQPNNNLKPLLPKPFLSIRKTDTGIILQWKMPYNLDVYESIASYQLFAYQETNATPCTDMWRKVGDVKALALPMACTLTQFADKNKYYFAVRSVDVHKRIGAFSDPEEISL